VKNLKSYFDTFMFITIQSNSFRGLTKKNCAYANKDFR
jgi:hypothetical protein